MKVFTKCCKPVMFLPRQIPCYASSSDVFVFSFIPTQSSGHICLACPVKHEFYVMMQDIYDDENCDDQMITIG